MYDVACVGEVQDIEKEPVLLFAGAVMVGGDGILETLVVLTAE
jgi:hypothetical protein